MKVTHVYRYSYPPLHGGIEQHIHTLVHQLKEEAEPEVLVSNTRPAHQVDDGVPLRSVGAWGHLVGSPISPTLPYWMRRSRPDLFHFHAPNPTGEMSYLMSCPGVPSVVTYHMETARYARALRLYRPFLEAFLRRTSRIIVSTPQHITSSAILPAFRDKCRVIPFGIDVRRFAPTPAVQEHAAGLRARYGDRLLLFIGKLRHYKGLDYLLHALVQVRGRLLIVGEGEEKERLQTLAIELGVGERVVWLSHLEREQFIGTLHACDVFVLPSIYKTETFGIAQLEAQACGKPVVCTALGTGVEYVNLHGQTGLVVPPQDARALGEAINRLLDNREYREGLGSAARTRVHAEFTQERMSQSILNVYHEVLNVRPLPQRVDPVECAS